MCGNGDVNTARLQVEGLHQSDVSSNPLLDIYCKLLSMILKLKYARMLLNLL